MMTSLMLRIREMTEEVSVKRGRPMLISIRIPDSVDYCKAIGIDLIKWLEDDLIDIVVGGGYFHIEPWENLVALGKKYGAPVYACLSASRIQGDMKVWRGEAMNAWEAGVDGIYTFNRFNPRDQVFRELGDYEALKALESAYEYNPGSAMDSWLKDGSSFLKK